MQPMTLINSHFDIENWAYGLGGAFVGGFANSASSVIAVMWVAPKDFNFIDPIPLFKVGLITGLVGGVLAFLGVLKNTPLPQRIVETKSTLTEIEGAPVKQVTEVKTTEVKTVKGTGDGTGTGGGSVDVG